MFILLMGLCVYELDHANVVSKLTLLRLICEDT